MVGSPLPCRILKGGILYRTTGIAQTGDWPVVGPASELLLHCLRKHRPVYVRVSWRLPRELGVKVVRVFRIGLECVNV